MIASRPAMTEHAEHVVLNDVSWQAYECLLEAVGDRRLRHSYDDGTLEIMSPLKRHDRAKKLLARLIEMAAHNCCSNIDRNIPSTHSYQENKVRCYLQ